MAKNGTRRTRTSVQSLAPPLVDPSIFGGSPRAAGDAAEAFHVPKSVITLADVRLQVAQKNGLMPKPKVKKHR